MPCTASPPCSFHEVPLESIDVQWGGDAVGRKALAYPSRRVIQLDPAFWRSLRTVDARAAILAHERAHIEGARCESCADRRAGEILRAEGTPTPRDGARALAGRLENRDGDAAARDFLEGFGLDLPTGGYVLNMSRAAGVQAPKVRALLARLDAHGLVVDGVRYSLTVGIDGGHRDDAAQLTLYSKGRARRPDGSWYVVNAADVVTNARTAAQTRHGQGRAVDLWILLPGGTPLLTATADPARFARLYGALGEVVESYGLTWGGRWTSPYDPFHAEDASFSLPTSGVAAALALALIAALAFLK